MPEWSTEMGSQNNSSSGGWGWNESRTLLLLHTHPHPIHRGQELQDKLDASSPIHKPSFKAINFLLFRSLPMHCGAVMSSQDLHESHDKPH